MSVPVISEEDRLRAGEERQAFLLQLSDALSPIADPVAVQEVAARMLGERMGANRTGYGEASEDAETIRVFRNYTNGVRGIEGVYRYEDFGDGLLDDFLSGRTVVIDDIPNAPGLSESNKAAYAELQMEASLNRPLLKDGKVRAVLFVHFNKPHVFTPEEVILLEDVAERTWAAVERARAEHALRGSEEKYRTLFNSLDDGFCIVEMIFDEAGEAVDYRFVETNPAFEMLTRLKDVVGKRIREFAPENEPVPYHIYEEIVRTGEPRHFEHYSTTTDRYFDIYAFRMGPEADQRVAVLFGDISRRKRREMNAEFLAGVQDDLARLGGTDEIMTMVAGRLGAHLRAAVYYLVDIEDDGEVVAFRHIWDMNGTYSESPGGRLSDFVSREVLEAYRKGDLVAVNDTQSDPRVSAEAARGVSLGAWVGIPFRQQGKLESLLSICDATPRVWREDEIELFRELAIRLFPRLERARADETVAADLHDTQLLRELGAKLISETGEEALFDEINAASMTLMHADAGTVQLCDPSRGGLVTMSVRGLPGEYRTRFGHVSPGIATSCGQALVVGDRAFVDFDDCLLEDARGDLGWHVEAGLLSAQSTPLIGRSGRRIGMITTHWKRHHRPSERELRYLDLLARQAADVIEQRQTEKKVSESEERLRTLFESMSEAFVILEALKGEDGNTKDFLYVECNPAFDKQMGFASPVGRRVGDILPDLEPVWVENCEVVLRTGVPLHYEGYMSAVGRWFTTSLSRIGGEGSRRVAVVFMDVTDRKVAEEGLRKSEARLSSIFAEAEAGLSEVSMQGRFLRVNDTLCRILGRSREELIGCDLEKVSHAEDMPFCREQIEKLIATGEPVSLDKRYLLPDGGVIWANSTLSLLDQGEGQEPVILAVTVDLTERKRAEEALRDSQRHLELVLESVRDHAIITVDVQGGITGWNPGAERIFGYGEKTVLGQSFALIFTKEDRSAGMPQKELETARMKGVASDERWHLRRDGALVWLSGTVSPLLAGDEITGYVKIAADLTERRNSENALRQSEERLRIVLESAEMGAWDWDVVADRIQWNERHFYLLGISPDAGVRRAEHFMKFVHPDDRQRVMDRLTMAIVQGSAYQAEFRIVRADTGEVRWMAGYGRTVEKNQGRATRLTGVMYDSTERKLSAEQLQRAHDELEYRVKERTQELSEALERLRSEIAERAKLEGARRELLKRLVTWQEEERGRISRDLHDNLGQHMVAVKLGLDAMGSSLKKPKEVEAFTHLRQGIDSLIKAAHRQAWELRPAELDHLGLEVALRHYVGDWAGRTGIPAEFLTECPDDARLGPQVEIAFYRVVQEALTNVARHSQASHVTVRLSMAEGGSVLVEDDGKGFEAGNVVRRLGLLGMDERISLIGGKLEVDTAPGKGTRVHAWFPCGLACVGDA